MNEITEEEEGVKLLKQKYNTDYNPEYHLSAIDQLQICETLEVYDQTPSTIVKSNTGELIDNVKCIEIENDTCEPPINTSSIKDKQDAIYTLSTYTYKTPPKQIAEMLEKLFCDKSTHPGHWLIIAQLYTPLTINRVIKLMLKQHKTGEATIHKPAAYFTKVIGFRAKRKKQKPKNLHLKK